MAGINPTNPLGTGAAVNAVRSAIARNEGTIRRDLNGLDARGKADYLARQLETTFMNQMLRAMRKASPESGLLGTDPGSKMFRELLDNEYAQLASEQMDSSFHQALVRQIVDGMGGTMSIEQAPTTAEEGPGKDVQE